MHIKQKDLPRPVHRLAVCWRATRQAYRLANLASHHLLGALLKLSVVVYFVFGLTFLALRYAILPNIDHYKGDIEQLTSHLIGRTLTVERIYASWHGLKPHFFLGDVVLLDHEGRQALKIPSISATLSWWSVLTAQLRLDSLEIGRPDLDIRREADGKIYIAGFMLDPAKSGDGKDADWLLSQQEVVIRDGRLRWTDSKRSAPPLLLDHVNLLLRNQWRRHQFGLQALPPADFSGPIDVRANFVEPRFSRKASQLALWKGQLFADARDTDLAVWKAYIDYPVEVHSGKGSVRAWLDLDHAKLADFTADVTLADLRLRLRHDLQPLHLAQVSGRISASEQFDPNSKDGNPTFGTHGHQIALTDFSLTTADGLSLPKTTLSETYVAAKGNRPEQLEIQAQVLDLQTLANFAERLPFSAAQRQMLTDFALRGRLHDFSARWEGSYPAIAAYQVKGQFTGLSLQPRAARAARVKSAASPAQAAISAMPGFDNLNGQIEANDKGGTLSLTSDRFNVHMPAYLADPVMPFDQLQMQAGWHFQGKDELLLQLDKLDFVQQGMAVSVAGKHLLPLKPNPARPLGTADFNATLSKFDVKTIGRYLPLQTPTDLRHWLTGALEDGMAQDVHVKLKGDLSRFPFHVEREGETPAGEFLVTGRIENGRLNYTPGHFAKDGKSPLWPVAEQIQGRFSFDRTRMEIKGKTGRTAGAALSDVTAVIPDLASHDMQLNIDGSAAATLQEYIRYVNISPVGDWIANFTEETKASGTAKLALQLHLPLARLLESKVQGVLQLANNEVTLQNDIPMLSAANGKLEFNEKGFNLNGVSASFLGGFTTIAGGSQPDGTLAIKAAGMVTPDGLRNAYPTPLMQRMSEHITGSARYSAAITVKKHQPEVVVESSLQGLGLVFPAPLRKAAIESLPLRFQLTGLASDDPNLLRDEIKLSLGTLMSAQYQRQKPAGKGGEWSVLRGGVGVNVPAPQPDSGLVFNVEMAALNVDAWRSLASVIAGNGQASKAGTARTEPKAELKVDAAPTEPPVPAANDALNLAQYIEPEVLAAHTGELIIMNKKLDNVVVGASHQKGLWQANIDSAQASGYLAWQESANAQGMGKVTARLATLSIPKSAASDMGELLEAKNETTQMPALDIVAENFDLLGKKMGRLEVQANNVRAVAGREWRIEKLSLSNDDAVLSATGNWRTRGGDSTTNLDYSLDMHDAGRLLDRFGFPGVLRGGKGVMDGNLSWKGIPFSIDIPSMSGQITLDMARGQFLKVDPGAAKLLGVLSLQALPRRLSLDFRDVFSEGFAFDGIAGTAIIDDGFAKTDSFKMRSVNATVLMDGTVDIGKETQNLHVVVIPEINAGAASVVYGLAVNPVIGLGTFLAQLFLREPLMRAFTFEYHIAGSWKDPTVTKLTGKAAKADE